MYATEQIPSSEFPRKIADMHSLCFQCVWSRFGMVREGRSINHHQRFLNRCEMRATWVSARCVVGMC